MTPAGTTLTPTLSQAIQHSVIGTTSPPHAMPLSTVSCAAMPNIPVNIAGGVPMASRTFAAAAAEAVPAATSELPPQPACDPAMQQMGTADVTAQTLKNSVPLQPQVSISGMTGPSLMNYNLKGLSGFQGIDMRSSPTNLSNAVNPDIAMWNPDSLNERKEIAAKYLFIYQLLDKLVKSAEFCYKLHSKHGWLNSYSDNKSAKRMGASPLQAHHVQLSATQCWDQLVVALANFDKARASVHWLYRDYELVYAMHKLNDQMALIKARRHVYATQQVASQVIGDWTSLLNDMERRRFVLDQELQANEREALSLGLTFLDMNHSGGLEPEEVPELSANLFAFLDVNNNKRITHMDLQTALSRLTSSIKANISTLNELNSANFALRKEMGVETNLVKMSENELSMKKLVVQIEQETATLRAIYQYFHTAFARHVFNKLDADVSASQLDVNLLFDDIECVSSSRTSDPLLTTAHPTQPQPVIPGATTMINPVPASMIGTVSPPSNVAMALGMGGSPLPTSMGTGVSSPSPTQPVGLGGMTGGVMSDRGQYDNVGATNGSSQTRSFAQGLFGSSNFSTGTGTGLAGTGPGLPTGPASSGLPQTGLMTVGLGNRLPETGADGSGIPQSGDVMDARTPSTTTSQNMYGSTVLQSPPAGTHLEQSGITVGASNRAANYASNIGAGNVAENVTTKPRVTNNEPAGATKATPAPMAADRLALNEQQQTAVAGQLSQMNLENVTTPTGHSVHFHPEMPLTAGQMSQSAMSAKQSAPSQTMYQPPSNIQG